MADAIGREIPIEVSVFAAVGVIEIAPATKTLFPSLQYMQTPAVADPKTLDPFVRVGV
jgi:hypothetical protein